jgi:ABC-type transport system substrate-binding protein
MLNQRLARRRLLATTGLTGAAALIAACGGGSNDQVRPASGLLYAPVDTSKSAKHGGVFRSSRTNEPLNFDLHNFDQTKAPFSNVVGSQLVKMKPGKFEDPSLQVEGDLAQSWELSPDFLTLTLKLHPQAKWSPLSRSFHDGLAASVASSIPNRTVDSDDLAFSWDRFKSQASAIGRLDLSNEAAPSAPVLSLVKLDSRTIQFKLARPFAPLLTTLARPNAGYLYILPKEGRDGAIDFLKYQFGAGPFYIDRFEPSVGITLRRNPNFELRDTEYKRPFVETVELPLVRETAQAMAQYRAGNVFVAPNSTLIGAEEVIQLKRDFPEHLLLSTYTCTNEALFFGTARESPFKDVRVRQAFSYAWDRDLLVQALFSSDKLEVAGIPANVRWTGGLPCSEVGWPNGTYKGWWLDPKSKDFGENARYFTLGERKRDLAEAKALLSAAGFGEGFTFNSFTTTAANHNRSCDAVNAVIEEAGFKAQKRQLQPPEILGMITNSNPKGNFNGTYVATDPTAPDPGTYLYQLYHRNGGNFYGYNPGSTGASADGDPLVNDLTEKLLTEFDEKKRMQMVFDFQRYHAKLNYRPRIGGGATTLTTSWPALQNQGVWRGDLFKRDWCWEWLDSTKAPLA